MAGTSNPHRHFGHRRLTPPASLTEDAATLFRQIVAAVDADHFAEVDAPLVAEYARAIDMANQAAQQLASGGAVLASDKASPWIVIQEKATRAMVALCARLRLSPQSRFDRLVAGTNSRKQLRWEDLEDDDGLLARPDDDPLDEFRNRNTKRKPKAKVTDGRAR